MSHCGLCGSYINDPHDDWYICADCVDDPRERLTPAHWLSITDRLRALFGFEPKAYRVTAE